MKHQISADKANRKATGVHRHEASGGGNATSLAPPAYGIDFVDRDAPAAVPVQRVVKAGEEEPMQRTFDAASASPLAQPESSHNRTGMPDRLKAGIESLSGMSLDNVKVHYNSSRPAQLNALAYAQGSDIHVAPGQEQHLPHEAWHVVQQAQGRVQPTMQMQGGVTINDDRGLEREADLMGGQAVRLQSPAPSGVATDGSKQPSLPRAGTDPFNARAARRRESKPAPTAPIQRTPADWAASADFVRILAHPHGWFSTWKQIKEEIRAYSALGNAQLDQRRTTLQTIRRRIGRWEADPKHTAASTEQRVQAIRADIPLLKFYVNREFVEVAIAADAIAGGHAETRHGADLTDDQLIHRLTSGVDRAGQAAATDTSSRFATHQLLLQTKTTAVNQLDAARVNTIAHFIVPLTGFIAAWDTFEGTAPGPAKGVAGGHRNTARQAVHTAAGLAAIPIPNPNLLRVDVNNPPYAGVAAPPGRFADIQGRVRGMLDTKNRYKIVIDHGQNMGPSFAGTGLPGGPHPGGVAAPPTQKTMTILQPGVVNLVTAPAAAIWATVTHYPCDPGEPVGISP